MKEKMALTQCGLEIDTRIAALRRAESDQIDPGIAGIQSYVDALVDIGMVDQSFREEINIKTDEVVRERREYLFNLDFALLSFFVQWAALVGASGSAIAMLLGRSVPHDYQYLLVFGFFFLQGFVFVLMSIGYRTVIAEALKYKIKTLVSGALIGLISYFITSVLIEARYAIV